MYLDNLKVGIRRLVRERSYASVAIVSLAIGIASFGVLGNYVLYEISYDQYHQSADQIYRVVQTEQRADPYYLNRRPATGMTFAPLMARTDSSYSDFLRIQPIPLAPYLLSSEDNAIYWDDVVIADENIFEFFDHRVLRGDPGSALGEPNTIAISESMASAYFGNDDPIGRQLFTDQGTGLKVNLVFEDLPANTHLSYSAVISRLSLNSFDIDSADARMLALNTINTNISTYFRLPESFTPESFDDSLRAMTQTYLPAIANREGFVSEYDWYLERLPDIHLNSLTDGSDAQRNRYLVLTYIAVGGFILLIANLNYTNLSISRYARRTKELGIRKIVGARRSQLIRLFFAENSLVLIVALFLAAIIAPVIQASAPLGGILDGAISLSSLLNAKAVFTLLLAILLVGSLAALYPALYLTRIKIIDIVSGKFKVAKASFWTKELIIFVQFVVSTGGIVCAILMLTQMNHIQSAPLGFDVKNKVAIQVRGKDNVERIPLLEDQLRAYPGVLSTAITDKLPFTLSSISTGYVESDSGERQTLPYHRIYGDSNYAETFGLELIQGRNLSALPSIQSTNAVIVNEAFVEAMSWDNPIGKILFTPGAYGLSEVVGVARNFNYLGFDTGNEPIAISTLDQQAVVMRERNVSLSNYYRYLIVALGEGETNDAIQFIRKTYNSFDPSTPLLFEFIEDRYDALRAPQINQATLMTMFSVISVFVACSGLIGLVAFKLETRVREMGIRKVLGASQLDLVMLQLRGVLVTVVPGALVGCVFASWVFAYWQAQFSADYRISQQYLSYLIAVGVVVGLALLATTLQTLIATRTNPVQSLRYE